jgi:hypothetical protein
VLDELQEHGHVIDPKDAKEKKVPFPGAGTLDNEDEHVLLALREQDLIVVWQATSLTFTLLLAQLFQRKCFASGSSGGSTSGVP